MTVYERIKYLRKKRKMSQQELAEKVGYHDKSAISKVERGDRDINQSMIVKYAEALRTTPAYLMGWTDQEENYGFLQLFASEAKTNSNIIIHSRDGSTLESELTDDQLEIVKRMIEQFNHGKENK